jgi:hypothetical protein
LTATSKHFEFAAGRRAEDLIIPHDFRERERHVLLRLVLDDLRDLVRVHRRQFDELGKNVVARRADVDVPRLDALFNERFLKRLEDDRLARGFRRAFGAERLDGKSLESQPARLVDFKLRQLEAARPKIHRQK